MGAQQSAAVGCMAEIVIRKGGRYGIAYTPGCYCELCGPSGGLPQTFRVTTMDTWDDDSGSRRMGDVAPRRKACPTCGMAMKLLEELIPIECQSYDCPECGLENTLEFRITKVATQELPDSRFGFETMVKCLRCNTTRVFDRQIESLAECVKIQLSFDGVELSFV